MSQFPLSWCHKIKATQCGKSIVTGMAMEEPRVLIFGLDGAGKTTFLYRLKLGEVVKTAQTIGFNVETLTHKKFTCTAWDFGGRDNIRTLYKHYYTSASGLLWMVDASDEERLPEAKEALWDILTEGEQNLEGVPLLILANKQDLASTVSVERVTESLELHKLERRKWHVFPIVANSEVGMVEAMDWFVEALTGTQAPDNTYSSSGRAVEVADTDPKPAGSLYKSH